MSPPIVEVDFARVRNKATLLSTVAKALSLPAHFGMNWDALADALQDLPVGPEGCVLRLKDTTAAREALVSEWPIFLEILEDAAAHWKGRGKSFVPMFDYKLPVSVLVLVHTTDLRVLLLERADRPGFWQSVTGSQHAGESLEHTAVRELYEETGIDAVRYGLLDWRKQHVFEIYPHWRYRYAPGVTHNTEHVFALELPQPVEVRLAPREHLACEWLPWQEAADRAFSWTNSEAIRELPARLEAARKNQKNSGGTGT